MTTFDSDCREVVSIIRGAARTPLRGMTPSEIETRTRLTLSIIRSCIHCLLESKEVAMFGQRNGESVYGLFPDN